MRDLEKLSEVEVPERLLRYFSKASAPDFKFFRARHDVE
jgi:hypothetical protein